MSIKFSVVIPTFNRPDDLGKLLPSILGQTQLPSQVIVVDQSTNALTRDLVSQFKSQRPAITFVYVFQENKSLVEARNRGLEYATGDIVSYIDDDIVLDPCYFEAVGKYFQNPNVVGVTGNVLNPINPSGIKWNMRKILFQVFLINNFKGGLTLSGFGYPIYERTIAQVMEVELFSGYSMNFRRAPLLAERSDEVMSGYSFREDVDLSFRMSRRGKLILVPDAKFYHNHSSVSRLDLLNLKKMQFKNYWYLFTKHCPQNLLYKGLFYYSLFGILFIDLIEYLLNFNRQKWAIVKADFWGMLAFKSSS